MTQVVKGITPSLQWISDLLSYFQVEAIKIPTEYRSKVLETKKILNDDVSGLLNTMLDFAITSALVEYRVETNNDNLTEVLSNWLKKINSTEELRGKIPTGLEPLAKEYFRERWKGSSHLLLRTFWEKKDGLELPTNMFFVDGEDILVRRKSKDGAVRLGDETYAIRINGEKELKLPQNKEELIFVQRPYESWGIKEPTPFIIKRGLFRNAKFLALLSSKGEYVVGRALEYLLVLKKGTERLALEGRPEMTYDENDLKGIRDDLKKMLMEKKNETGAPLYTTNFDTQLEHFIPDYSKAINDTIYGPIEKRLLAGLGLINIVEGVGATRRESILNPKPFVEEVRQGIRDFKTMLNDIVITIVERNISSHPKWMNSEIKINNSLVKAFMTDKFLTMLRSMYDRGRLSSRTFVEVVGDLDYDREVKRRQQEKKEKHDKILFPPVIQNIEQHIEPTENVVKNDNIPDDKKGPEKKNFKQSSWDKASTNLLLSSPLRCMKCEYEGDLSEYLDTLIHSETYNQTVSICPGCGEELLESDVEIAIELEESKITKRKDGWHVISKDGKHLGGPYKTKKEAVKRLQQVEYFKH